MYWSNSIVSKFHTWILRFLRFFGRTYDFSIVNLAEITHFLRYIVTSAFISPNQRVNKFEKYCHIFSQNVSVKTFLPVKHLDLPTEVDPLKIAKISLERHGTFPISFVAIDSMQNVENHSKSRLISSIIPGQPYLFHNEEDYYFNYLNSHFAFTFKKCGWDSFRNVEIISHGSIPLYLHAKKIPRFTMTFYPKKSMSLIARKFLEEPFIMSDDSTNLFFESCQKYLQTSYLYYYLNELVGIQGKDILYLDDSLDSRPDYLSMMVLISLARYHDLKVHVTKNYRYLTTNETFESEDFLYGRGFGYRGRLSGNQNLTLMDESQVDQFEGIVIIGNVLRNKKSLAIFSNRGKTLVSICGEDLAPSRSELNFIQNASSHVFLRELNHPFVVP